ncbi:hypothetical protein M5D96_014228, partial [Drosophila gunungcola]
SRYQSQSHPDHPQTQINLDQLHTDPQACGWPDEKHFPSSGHSLGGSSQCQCVFPCTCFKPPRIQWAIMNVNLKWTRTLPSGLNVRRAQGLSQRRKLVSSC